MKSAAQALFFISALLLPGALFAQKASSADAAALPPNAYTLEQAKLQHDFPASSSIPSLRTQALKTVILVAPDNASARQKRYYELAVSRLKQRAENLQIKIAATPPQEVDSNTLIIHAGLTGETSAIDQWLAQSGIPPLSPEFPGSEGFAAAIATDKKTGAATAYIAGVDERGVLYGLGWLLWQTRITPQGITLPEEVSPIITAPRLRLRSANGNERQAMDAGSARLTGARRWKHQEGVELIKDQWLLGANQYFQGWGSSVPVEINKYNPETGAGVSTVRSQLADDYGIDYAINNSINGINRGNMKSGWEALDAGALHNANVCVSNPQARAFLLDIKEKFFRHAPRIDRIVFNASDVAGCDCPKCAPWVKTYWDLCNELAQRLHKYHPEAKVHFTNQDFQTQDNRWFFEKVMKEQPSWLGGYAMAPGGNEGRSYGGVIPDRRWWTYGGLFPVQNFLRSRLRYLAPQYEVIAFPDISHWKRAEYGLPYIDPILSEVYHRRTFNARPVYYHRVITSYMPYVDGILGYSEGNYDDFNKFLLLRLAWNPDLTPYQLAREYYAYHVGEAAADLLAQAAIQGEKNYELPVLKNKVGIQNVYNLTTQARKLIPENVLKKDWRYAMLAQRAATDLYLFERQSRFDQTYRQIIEQLAQKTTISAAQIEKFVKELEQVWKETALETKLRTEAEALDLATDQWAGVRSSALKVIKDYDGVGIGWLSARLKEAAIIKDDELRMQKISDIANYDRVGANEFYENGGTLDGQPHFDFSSGELYYGTGSIAADSRPSQRTYNYSTEHQEGLRYRFSGLDANSDYELSFVYGNPGGVSFSANSDNAYAVRFNGETLLQETPSGKTYEVIHVRVPARLFPKGEALLEFVKDGKSSRSTCISEVWLRKMKEPDASRKDS